MTADLIEHDKTPDTHSSIVGGSSAAQMLGCPGSYNLLQKVPDSIRNASSKYADEGTALHEVMAYLVENDIDIDAIETDGYVDGLFVKYSLDRGRMYDAVLPAYRQFNEYCDKLEAEGPEDLRIRVEVECEMPGIEGPNGEKSFGTTDILIRGPKRTVIWDWKMGGGQPVSASYEKGGDEFGNDQLTFYGRAAQNSFPDYFEEADDWPVDLVICQPRILTDDPASFTVTVADLEDFRLDLIDAVDEALGDNPRIAKGKYCFFAACKTICPLHLNAPGQMLELGQKLQGLRLRTAAAKEGDTPIEVIAESTPAITYGEALAIALDLAEMLEPYHKEAVAQAQTYMEAGGVVPGRKLVPKKAGWDSWEDEKKTDDFLSRQKLSLEERRKPWTSITPAAARKVLKGKGASEKTLSLLEKYVKPGVSSGHTLARSDDPRPEIQATRTAVDALAAKLKALGNA